MVENADLVAHGHRLDLVVGDEEKGRAELHLQVLELRAKRLAELGVEIGQRLIHEEGAGLAYDRAADRDPLHLAAGELVGLAIEQMVDAQRLGRRGDAPINLVRRVTAHPRLQREGEVFADGVSRIERVVLEDQRDVALRRRPVGDVLLVDEHPPIGRLVETGDEAKRRRLARAGRAEKDEELAVGDVEREIAHRGRAAELLGDPVEPDMRHLSCRA